MNAADALRMAFEPPPPLVIGVDLAHGQDLTAITLLERTTNGSLLVHEVRTGHWEDQLTVDRIVDAMKRDFRRPAGYSNSHWRKIWRQRQS